MPVRALIVLLIVLNLGVALWWIARDQAPPPEATPVPAQGVERLRLLAEGAAGPEPAQAVVAAVAAGEDAIADPPPVAKEDADATPALLACHAFGPFGDAAAADRAAAQLQPLALRLATRETRTAPRGWNVVLPGLAGREAADAAAAGLVEAGFRDYYLMPATDDGTVDIALGRFGSEEAALRHQAALRAAGFDAIARPIGEAGVRYWIDVAAAADADVGALRRSSGASRADVIYCATVPDAARPLPAG